MAIGFDLEAKGSNGFRRSSGAWTEGSLIALKIVMSVPKVNVPGTGKTNRGIISGIEASFSQVAKSLLDNVTSDGMNFTLFMKGDVKFKMFWDYSKSSDEIKAEFLRRFGEKADGEIGDQVLIHICRTIQDFFLVNLTNNEPLILEIDLDL
jgi:hypothetical protein